MFRIIERLKVMALACLLYTSNEIDRFHLVKDVLDRVPNLGSKGDYLKPVSYTHL